MARPDLEFGPEALTVRLRGLSGFFAAKWRITVPYRAVAHATVGPPVWPRFLAVGRVGTHLPRVWAFGTFVAFRGPRRRAFYYISHETRRALTLELRGVWYDTLVLDVDEPDAALRELELRGGPGGALQGSVS